MAARSRSHARHPGGPWGTRHFSATASRVAAFAQRLAERRPAQRPMETRVWFDRGSRRRATPSATVAATVQDHRGRACRVRSLGGAWRTSSFASNVAALAQRPDHHVRRHPYASRLWSVSTAGFLARRRRPSWSFEAELGLVSTDPVVGSGLADSDDYGHRTSLYAPAADVCGRSAARAPRG